MTRDAPTGTVTFLFTDLEGSTRLWETRGDEMRAALEQHDAILRREIDRQQGYVFSTAGDSFGAAFHTVDSALGTADRAQRLLRATPWPDGIELRCRMGIHAGVAQERDGDYFGATVNRASRVMSAAHGGQVLVSDVVAELASEDWILHPLGVHRLRDLREPIRLHQLAIDDVGEYPALRTLEPVRQKLPVVRSEFFGRRDDVWAVSEMIDSASVVTLTGVGGVGKTRLALEVAGHRLDRHEPVVFVDLSIAAGRAAVIGAVAAALDLDVAGFERPEEDLARSLRSRDVLLILDNCEHVIDAAADLVDAIAASSPRVRVLATSREALGVEGERVHRVRSLAEDAAIALFFDRAARPVAAFDEHARRQIAEICVRLDGIPLAIELAAARTSHMTVREIAGHLDERFSLLSGGRRRGMARQQTLQATMDWSYQLLGEKERSLLRCTAVFVGGFDARAVAVVWGEGEIATINGLGSLVDKSLVIAAEEAGHSRYRLLETVRLFARQHLTDSGELAARRRAHAEHFLGFALRHPPQLAETDRWGWERSDATDLDNNLLALDWFEQGGDLEAVGMLGARLNPVLHHGRFVDGEGRYLGRSEVAEAIGDRAERALYWYSSCLDASLRGDFQGQLRHGEMAMELATDPTTRAAAAGYVANAFVVLDHEAVEGFVDRTLEQVAFDDEGARRLLVQQSLLARVMRGDLTSAIEGLEELLRLGDDFSGFELLLLLHVIQSDERLEELSDQVESYEGSPLSYRIPLARALAALTAGDSGIARMRLAEAAWMVETNPVRYVVGDVLVALAALAYHEGDLWRASRLLAVVAGPPGGPGWLRTPASLAFWRRYRDLVKERLPSDEIDRIRRAVATEGRTNVMEAELAGLRVAPEGSQRPSR